jgi:hypothetical protein
MLSQHFVAYFHHISLHDFVAYFRIISVRDSIAYLHFVSHNFRTTKGQFFVVLYTNVHRTFWDHGGHPPAQRGVPRPLWTRREGERTERRQHGTAERRPPARGGLPGHGGQEDCSAWPRVSQTPTILSTPSNRRQQGGFPRSLWTRREGGLEGKREGSLRGSWTPGRSAGACAGPASASPSARAGGRPPGSAPAASQSAP